MSIADIVLSLVIFILQKLVLPVLPTNFPLLDLETFNSILRGTLEHNLAHSFVGMSQLFNIELLFILVMSVIVGEILFWLVRAGLWIIGIIRG